MKIFSIKVTDALHERIEEAAEARGLTRHGFVRECVLATLDGRVVESDATERNGRLIREQAESDRQRLAEVLAAMRSGAATASATWR